jgi:hypothetical protein
VFAWLLCALAGYMAWQLSGVAEGIARVALGPVLGLVMLHLALGIEIRTHHTRSTTWARIGRELRERVLSRLGLSNDERDALARTRDRAARRVARLSLARMVPLRTVRVARALRASNVAHDPIMRARMMAELAAIRHAAKLATLPQPCPWGEPFMNTPTDNPRHQAMNPVHDSVQGRVHDTVQGTPATGGGERSRPRSRTTARKPTKTKPTSGRRLLAEYVADARAHLTPGVVPSPAWVREVLPGVARGTSQNVANALNAELTPQPTEPAEESEIGAQDHTEGQAA